MKGKVPKPMGENGVFTYLTLNVAVMSYKWSRHELVVILLFFSCQNYVSWMYVYIPPHLNPLQLFPDLTNPKMITLGRSSGHFPSEKLGVPGWPQNICLPTEIRGILKTKKIWEKRGFFFYLDVDRPCKATNFCFFVRRYVSLVLFFFLYIKLSYSSHLMNRLAGRTRWVPDAVINGMKWLL